MADPVQSLISEEFIGPKKPANREFSIQAELFTEPLKFDIIGWAKCWKTATCEIACQWADRAHGSTEPNSS